MAYKMYLDGVLMPITPSKVKVKINNQNETLTLISGEEINILKAAGLTDVSFDLLLPQVPYPFTNGGAQPADYYLSLFERLKTAKEPFQWILNREKPNGSRLFYTNLTVGMEDYQITDDAEEGFDTINLSFDLYYQREWSWDDVSAYVTEAINGYFLELAQSWADQNEALVVRISQVESRLLGITGILDIANTKINGEAANCTLTLDHIPVLGTIEPGTIVISG